MAVSESKPNPKGPDIESDEARPNDAETRAWEEIDAGRYMPRRIRGSYRGRSLG